MPVTELSYEMASPSDAPAVFSMCKELIDTYEDIALIDYNKVISWVERKINQNIASYTCIMMGKEKVGYFSLQLNDTDAELDDLYIFPEYRGKGIGTKVISHCIEKAKMPIFLYVFRKNTDAIRLYCRMGFSVSKEVGATRLIMRREVDNRE